MASKRRNMFHKNKTQETTEKGCLCLKNVVLWLPQAVKSGNSLQVSCHYDLEGAALYSIKFYQGDQEFYRYVPKESPPTRVFPLPGVQVDIYQSNSTVVTLSNVKRELTGLYKCEVSADAPLFHTIIRSAYVVVTVEPNSVPELTVEKTKYTLGERIRANCSSRSAYPAANLTFFINNMQVANSDMTKLSMYVETDRGGLETSVLELETVAVPLMFSREEGGRLRLRCLATQYSLYTSSADLFLQEDTPQLAHVLGPSSPHEPADLNCAPCSSRWLWLPLGTLLLAR